MDFVAGPYTPPAVRRWDRAFCLFRDCDVVVTSWSAAPVPWPRCRALHARGGSGLLMTDELRRAVLTESSAAVQRHFGVCKSAVNRWRKWAGVAGHCTTPGSVRAQRAAAERGADMSWGRDVPPDECDRRGETARRLGYRPPDRWAATGWTAAEDAHLGTAPDAEVAGRLGRTRDAVRARRNRLRASPP